MNQAAGHRHGDLIFLSLLENAAMKAIAERKAEPDLSTLGGRIESVRLARGMRQTKLASEAGLSQPSLSAIESNDTKEVTAIRLGRIARALKTTWEYLLFDSAYGHEPKDTQDEAELVAIFRTLLPNARKTLLKEARLIQESQPPATDPDGLSIPLKDEYKKVLSEKPKGKPARRRGSL